MLIDRKIRWMQQRYYEQIFIEYIIHYVSSIRIIPRTRVREDPFSTYQSYKKILRSSQAETVTVIVDQSNYIAFVSSSSSKITRWQLLQTASGINSTVETQCSLGFHWNSYNNLFFSDISSELTTDICESLPRES